MNKLQYREGLTVIQKFAGNPFRMKTQGPLTPRNRLNYCIVTWVKDGKIRREEKCISTLEIVEQ